MVDYIVFFDTTFKLICIHVIANSNDYKGVLIIDHIGKGQWQTDFTNHNATINRLSTSRAPCDEAINLCVKFYHLLRNARHIGRSCYEFSKG